jgi:short-subunit dehydrogenase
MQGVVRHLVETGKPGSIVNIISMVAHCGQSYLTPYSASGPESCTSISKMCAATFWNALAKMIGRLIQRSGKGCLPFPDFK